MRTFWLSFCDGDRPKGQQFLGACVVDVTDEEAERMKLEVLIRFPHALEGAHWIGAATRKAHTLGCNPGGEVASLDVTDRSPELLARYRRGHLMTRDEIEAIDALISMSDGSPA